MEMSGRPRRAALHQRSDSETNEIRTIPSLDSTNSSVSQKTNDVSSWVPHPTTASISRDSTRSSSRTTSTSTSRSRVSPAGLRHSGSLDSLPPVAPLKINKRESAFIVARDPPTTTAKESSSPDTFVGGSNSPSNATAIKTQTFPKSILKKPSRAALPPYSTEEYNRRSSSWVGSNSHNPSTAKITRMNARTLRIVRSEDGDGDDEEGEEVDVVGRLASQERSVSGTLSPRTSPSLRLVSSAESSTRVARIFPNPSFAARSPSNASLERPGTAGSLFASAKQLPAWAKYFYGKKGGRGSIIEPDLPTSASAHGNERIGRVGPRVRRQQSNDSLLITEVILPGAVYHVPTRFPSSESIPGLDWIGNRTRVMDPEVATQWSTPHLDNIPPSRSENIDRQLIMFCLGFVLPICWIIAAFLPLPKLQPRTKKQPHPENSEFPSYTVDVEAASNHSAVEARRYENARWWRRVNRVLSVFGLAIIGAIITLGVVAATRGV